MNLLNLFEDDSRTPNPNYAEELAYQIFKAAPNLDTTGAADEVLDYAFDLVVNDFGKKKAHALFAYDKDFDSDLVNAYLDLQMNSKAEEKKQVNEVDPRNFDSDEDYYAAQNAPVKRRSAPSDYPYSPEEDDAYFREIFRKKREAAKKAEQDKGSGPENKMTVGQALEIAKKNNSSFTEKDYYDLIIRNEGLGSSFFNSEVMSAIQKKQGVAEGQLNEYLVRAGMPVKDVLALNLFQDTSPDGQEGMDDDPRWRRLMKKYQPIANMLAKQIIALGKNRRLSDAEAEAVEEVWYDGSDAYDDMEIEYLADYYDQQIDIIEALLAGELQDEIDEGQQWPDNSNSLAKRKPVAAFNNQGVKAGRPGGLTVATRVEPTITPTSVKRLGGDRPIPSFLQKNVAEADKKKEDELEPQIKDVALQRAISRAKADFPTAGSGIEALSKDFMRSQDQDQKSFDQLRQAERKQDQMLGQIAKIDQEQEQEIKGLENQNSTLASRLQQLQNVNGELEKKLAAMSGRKAEKKSKTDIAITPAVAPTAPKPELIKPATKKAAKTKSAAPKSSMKSTAAQLAAPKADPMAAMSQRIQKGDASIITPKQQALPFEPSDNVLEPIIPQQQQVNPKFAAARANATDADVRYGRELADRIKQQMADVGRASPDYPDAERLRAMKKTTVENNDQEAKYSDKYQDMVARVGQKAREQEKSKPVDIKDLARRLAAIEASRKD